MADYNYYSPFRGNDLLSGVQSTLTNLMMMKKQQEEQEKVRAQEEKATINKLAMQHDWQKKLITFQMEQEKQARNYQIEQERQARNQKFQDTVAQTIEQYRKPGGGADALYQAFAKPGMGPPNTPNGQFPLKAGGQETMGIANYGAQMGQSVPGQQLFNNINKAQGYQVQQGIANTRADTSQANNIRNNQTRMAISDINDKARAARANKPPAWISRAPIAIRQSYESKKIDIEKMRQAELSESEWQYDAGTPEKEKVITEINSKYDDMLFTLKENLMDAYGQGIQNTGNDPAAILNDVLKLKKPSTSRKPPSAGSVSDRLGF